MWVPVHDEEWDGDIPLGVDRPVPSGSKDSQEGFVVFRGGRLPWKAGKYEVGVTLAHPGQIMLMEMLASLPP